GHVKTCAISPERISSRRKCSGSPTNSFPRSRWSGRVTPRAHAPSAETWASFSSACARQADTTPSSRSPPTRRGKAASIATPRNSSSSFTRRAIRATASKRRTRRARSSTAASKPANIRDNQVRSSGDSLLSREQKLELYYYMRLTRSLEERLVNLYRQTKVVGGLFRSLAQEADAVGSAYALDRGKGDILSPLIRNLGSMLVQRAKPVEILRQYMAKGESP